MSLFDADLTGAKHDDLTRPKLVDRMESVADRGAMRVTKKRRMDKKEILEAIARALMQTEGREIAAFGFALAFADGGTGASFAGPPDRLIGAAARLEHTVGAELLELERPERSKKP